MSTLKVDGIRSNSASSDAITLDGNGKCAVTGTTITADTGKFDNLPNRNLIINGAMLVAQRGTSSIANGIRTVDRFAYGSVSIDGSPTQRQADVASGTTPYSLGFRKSYKVTNGNQTSGAQAASLQQYSTRLEAQDIANSGWNYTDPNSKITLSFWVKSSVSQNFYGFVNSMDGTSQQYPFETGTLTADTWTKITKVITGNSNLQFDNDNEVGLRIYLATYFGTDYTDSSVSLNAWGTYSGSARTPNNTSTWYTTNDATFELTGVQLEVSDHATSFEHKSYQETYNKCLRYTYVIDVAFSDYVERSYGYAYSTTLCRGTISFPQPMRTYPSYTGNAMDVNFYAQNNSAHFHLDDIASYVGSNLSKSPASLHFSVTTSSMTSGQAGVLLGRENGGQMIFDAEI